MKLNNMENKHETYAIVVYINFIEQDIAEIRTVWDNLK